MKKPGSLYCMIVDLVTKRFRFAPTVPTKVDEDDIQALMNSRSFLQARKAS